MKWKRWIIGGGVNNHAVADGYPIANVFRLFEKETADFVRRA